MKKTYNVFFRTPRGVVNGEIKADNRREAKKVVEQAAENMNATEWYFELA